MTPFLYTPFADGVPAEFPADHLQGPLFPDIGDARLLKRALAEHFPAERASASTISHQRCF